MRIDKYLWCVRYYKTRTLATIACKKGQVKINNETTKPSREIYATDKIELRKNQIHYQLLVNDIPPSRIGAKLVDIYRTDITPKEQFEVEYYFIGKETSEDLQAIWCYLEITNIEAVESIVVENNLLMEMFADQKNIIHIMMPDKKQGYFMLEKGKSSEKAIF